MPDILLADRAPAFSPDGSRLAFFQCSKGPIGDFWVIPSTGGQARQLTFDDHFGGTPAWTPDGRFIVFSSLRAGSRTLWKIAAAGGEPEPVLMSAGEDTDRELSRDGQLSSAHDVSEGGLAIALAEASTGAAGLGAEVRILTALLPTLVLFSQSTPRAVVSFEPGRERIILEAAQRHGVPTALLGRVYPGRLRIEVNDKVALAGASALAGEG